MTVFHVSGLFALVALVFAVLNLVLTGPRKIDLVGWALLLVCVALLLPSAVALFK